MCRINNISCTEIHYILYWWNTTYYTDAISHHLLYRLGDVIVRVFGSRTDSVLMVRNYNWNDQQFHQYHHYHPKSLYINNKKKRPLHYMTLEIQVPAWEWHTNMAWLNRLIGSQPSPHNSGADPGFQVRGGAPLKKLRRAEGARKLLGYFVWKITILRQKIIFFPIAEGGAKIVGVFRVKNHDFTPKNHIFSNFRGGGARWVRLPWIRPCSRF